MIEQRISPRFVYRNGEKAGRGGETRTRDLAHPKRAL